MVGLRDISSTSEHLLPDVLMDKLKRLLQKSPDKPKHTIEYTVVTTTEDYEERRYPASTWACTTVTGVYQDAATIEGFRHLQTYSNGSNSASARLSMHPPILTRVSASGEDGFDRRFVVSTFMCTDHADGLPEPTSQHVYLEHLPEMSVFVRNFEGIACEEKWTYETRRLAEVLRNKEDIRTDFYITATYESPFQLVTSRNEIWFLKFDRENDASYWNRERSVLKYGEQKVEIPDVFGWLLQAMMAYLTIVLFVIRSTLFCSGAVKDNWSSIRRRANLATKVMRHNVSFWGLYRSAVSVVWTTWSLSLALISGVSAERSYRGKHM